jgi:hypothetical protein
VKELDGDALVLRKDHSYGTLPSVADLNDLSAELLSLAGEINEARLEGFLLKALKTKQAGK